MITLHLTYQLQVAFSQDNPDFEGLSPALYWHERNNEGLLRGVATPHCLGPEMALDSKEECTRE